MDTERLHILAASHRWRANATDSEYTRAYEDGMASYLEEAAAWIDARLKQEHTGSSASPGNPVPNSKPR